MEAVSKNTVLTKHQLAYRQIRNAIQEGSLKPGERIVISTFSSELGMSSIPIREAIGQLAREGLLTLRPHAGAVVSDIPLHAIEEIFALLESLEIAAIRLALPKLTEPSIQSLEALCGRMESTEDVAEWAKLNRKFHERIPDRVGLERVGKFLVRVGEDWERLRRLRFSEADSEDIAEANRQHREFVDLLRSGRLPPIEKWIREHNRHALKKYKAAVGARKLLA